MAVCNDVWIGISTNLPVRQEGIEVLSEFKNLAKIPNAFCAGSIISFSPLNRSFAALLYPEKRLFANTFYIRYALFV